MEHTETKTAAPPPRFQIFTAGRLNVVAVLRDNVKETDYPFSSQRLARRAAERIRKGGFAARLFYGSESKIDAYMLGDHIEDVVA